jgi:hypothetical protein
MFTYDNYETQRCEIHNTIIIYFKSNKIMSETQCWDCQKEVNQKKPKYENSSGTIQPQTNDPIGND